MDESKVKCSRCHCWRDKMEYLKNDRVLKSCISCRQNDIKHREKKKCEHGRQRSQCKECVGSSFCEHKRLRSQCKDCGGSQICEHGIQRSHCKDCGGSQICEHGRERRRCVDCDGSQICEHKRIRYNCVDCGGVCICEHGRRRCVCKECNGRGICEHKRVRNRCVDCGGSQICEHKRRRSQCIECDGSQICEHKQLRRQCVDCGGSQICEHKRVRSRCVDCGGSQICVHKRQKRGCQICNFNLYLINLQRNHIKRCFQYTSLKKQKSSIKYLGCDIDTFISHMEKKLTGDMTWDNIHIDHIKPVSRFNLDDEEEFNKCCHYTNLQPLLAKDNLNKNNKWTDDNEVFWNENIIYKDYDKIYL